MIESVRIEGLSELSDALKELPKRIAANGLRRAVSSGAALVRNEGRQRAPVLTGEMRRDIQIKRERESTAYRAVYSVYVRSGKKSRLSGRGRDVSKDSFYWKFVEFGTSKMTAHPFMRPAFEAQKMNAVEAIRAILAERIAAEAGSLNK